MTDAPVSVTRAGHRTFFKWHRARRTITDPVFTGRRIIEGMQAGASVEVDLVVTADHNFAVLHNFALEEETTGTGLVRETPSSVLRDLHLRDNEGRPIADKVMLLDDLCALMGSAGVHPDGLLQLDFKEDDTALGAVSLANFRRATAPFAQNFIVSSGNARAVDMLTGEVPGMLAGFDPSDEGVFSAALADGALDGFVRDAVAASPKAAMIYLAWQIVTLSADAGFDIVEAFHRHGKRVDAWTIKAADADTVRVVERLLALKVDQITTDDPEGMAALIR
jgi:glycerophosphoryl diester phosphodiesterase